MKLCPICKKKYEQIYGKIKIKEDVIHLFPICDDEKKKDGVK